jgi:hypothetical protein
VLLHDLSSDELIAGLRNATLELAIMVQPTACHATLFVGPNDLAVQESILHFQRPLTW